MRFITALILVSLGTPGLIWLGLLGLGPVALVFPLLWSIGLVVVWICSVHQQKPAPRGLAIVLGVTGLVAWTLGAFSMGVVFWENSRYLSGWDIIASSGEMDERVAVVVLSASSLCALAGLTMLLTVARRGVVASTPDHTASAS